MPLTSWLAPTSLFPKEQPALAVPWQKGIDGCKTGMAAPGKTHAELWRPSNKNYVQILLFANQVRIFCI